MNHSDVFELISRTLQRILEDKGEAMPQIDADTVLLGGSLAVDSLDLAAIVVEMDSLTGSDPFVNGFIEFRTVGELVALYTSS